MQNLASPHQVLLELLHDELVKYYASRVEGHLGFTLAYTPMELQYVGLKVGFQLLERLTGEPQTFIGEVEAVQFICTDLWDCLFSKHAGSLETNYIGEYMIRDDSFGYLKNITNGLQDTESADLAPLYTAFTAGLIQGILTDLFVYNDVVCEVNALPGCQFRITINDISSDVIDLLLEE